MKVMALTILWEIAENLRWVDFLSMISDEAIDVKNVSELVVCFTFLLQRQLHLKPIWKLIMVLNLC